MNLRPPYQQPDPAETPNPAEEPPVPVQQPKRRRIMQPVFSSASRKAHLMLSGLALCLTLGLSAQTTPGSTSGTPQTTPQPTTTPQRGWTMFDERIGTELQMPEDQLQQLRDLDGRFQREYQALGTDPTLSPKYRELTERRNAEIRSVMTSPMYETWNTKYNAVPNTIQEQRKGNSATSTPPPPRP